MANPFLINKETTTREDGNLAKSENQAEITHFAATRSLSFVFLLIHMPFPISKRVF